MKHKKLEEIVNEAREVQSDLENQDKHIYVATHETRNNLFQRAKDYWFSFMNTAGKTTAPAMRRVPGGEINYVLWRMPLKLHETVNKVLDYTASALERVQPEGAIYTGLISGASKIIYGIKNRSGDDLVYGMVGALDHLKEIDDPGMKPKIEKLHAHSMEILEKYFGPFKKSKLETI